jgi:hypothetical protein
VEPGGRPIAPRSVRFDPVLRVDALPYRLGNVANRLGIPRPTDLPYGCMREETSGGAGLIREQSPAMAIGELPLAAERGHGGARCMLAEPGVRRGRALGGTSASVKRSSVGSSWCLCLGAGKARQTSRRRAEPRGPTSRAPFSPHVVLINPRSITQFALVTLAMRPVEDPTLSGRSLSV